jgi:hypothetical protein
MDLNLTMRYCMVQAQREAAGAEVSVEHIFLAILSLYNKQTKEIARKPEQEDAVRADLENINESIKIRSLNASDLCKNLREKLVNSALLDGNVAGLLARAEKQSESLGHSEIAAAVVFGEAFTPLVNDCIAGVGSAAATVFDETAAAPKPEPKPIPPPKPLTPQPPVIFFESPANNAKDVKNFKAKRKTKVGGIKFRGNAALSAVQYFAIMILITVLSWFLADSYGEQLQSSEEQLQTLKLLILFAGAILLANGITSLIGRRFKSFQVFAATCFYVLFIITASMIAANIFGRDEPWLILKILVTIYGLASLGVSVAKLKPAPGQAMPSLSTAMLKVQGTPGAIFFSYGLRSLMIPGLVAAVLWIGNLQVNSVFHAIFSIYAFLWICETIRVMIMCWGMKFNNFYGSRKGKKLQEFMQTQYGLLLLPSIGLFLMWYFNWFPMPVWVIVLYSIYGFIWLMSTIALIQALRK